MCILAYYTCKETRMPTYTYCCNKCNKKFELFFFFKDYIDQPKCSHCGSMHTYRSYIDDAQQSISFVKKSDSELKTIGDIANRNRDRMSDDHKLELYNKHNNYKEQESKKELPKGMQRIKKSKTKNKWY